jgi:hypothetical protein
MSAFCATLLIEEPISTGMPASRLIAEMNKFLASPFFHQDEVAGKNKNFGAVVGRFTGDLVAAPLVPGD